MADVVRVVVGRIGRAHGVRGELAVDVRTDEPERRFAASARLHGGNRTLTVSRTRWHSGRLLVTFAEVDDRTAAEALRGTMLEAEVDATERPSDDSEFYDRQLIGLDAKTVGGDLVGQVASVVHHDEQDTLVITRAEGADVLVPFVAQLVPTVDLAGSFLVIADVPGLLDPEQAD